MVSKLKTYLLQGRNEGRSKSTFRQLRISTLWTSKGYEDSMEIYLGNRNITLPHVVTRFPVYDLPTLIVGEEFTIQSFSKCI